MSTDHPKRNRFQLTPSRRATNPRLLQKAVSEHFNSRPHGGRPSLYTGYNRPGLFQLTPSRRATTANALEADPPEVFQLTPSRRATTCSSYVYDSEDISTHALTEGDSAGPEEMSGTRYFNSRPHGGRHHPVRRWLQRGLFQLTPSRRATASPLIPAIWLLFQLTPSRRAT